MLDEVRCTNPHCGHPSRFGGDVLGRAFRCVRCGSLLPRRGSVVTRSEDQGAPWEAEEVRSGHSLGAALPARIGRYLVRDRLDSRATSTTYLAFDPELSRMVALKVPHTGRVGGGSAADQFVDDAKILARLNHPHIIPVFDAGRDHGTPYLASRFVEGRTLDVLLEHGVLSSMEAARMTADLADALAYAHGQGIVHGNLRPSSVHVDPRGHAYLTEFDLGRGVAEGAESEVPWEAEASEEGDQHALGAVLFEMLCGHPPLADDSEGRESGAPILPHELRGSVPRVLEAVCLDAMGWQGRKRFSSCAEMADALRLWISRRERREAALEPLRRAGEWARRKPAAALSAGLSLLGVLATTVLASALISSVALSPRPTLERAPATNQPPMASSLVKE
ncbi:MAG: serine/threonine-protein kinase [Isosphaeraceae bacterium]